MIHRSKHAVIVNGGGFASQVFFIFDKHFPVKADAIVENRKRQTIEFVARMVEISCVR